MRDYIALFNDGAKLYRDKKIDDALFLFRELLDDVPDDFAFRVHRGLALCLLEMDEVKTALRHYGEAFRGAEKYGDSEERRLIASNYLMYLHYIDGISDDFIRDEHFRFNDIFAGIVPFSYSDGERKRRRKKRKIRVGYLSPDIGDHIVMNFAVQLFAAYDRDRFEAVLYETGGSRGEVTQWLETMTDGHRDLSGMSPREAAKRIHDDDVDILFDLAGHTVGGETLAVMAHHPAPVTMCGIGYFDTTGLSAVDYYLGDVYCDPPSADDYFRERIIRLPRSHLCYTPPEAVLDCKREHEAHDDIVFGSFNNFWKITDEMLMTWKEILSETKGSRLILKNVRRGEEHARRMEERLKNMGFDMARVEVRAASFRYLDEYMDIDIALDTYPYPGGGTTCEALYMGVPVVSLYGSRHGSRFGYSILSNIGLAELAACSRDDYIARAKAIAGDRELIGGLHENLRAMMRKSPLMDTRGYLRDIEKAYENIWQDFLT